MILYRAASAEAPWSGRRSFWTPRLQHAEWYRTIIGFGGPIIYSADLEPTDVLDLRRDPWMILNDLFELERDDYGAGELDHDIYQDLAPVFIASGHRWVVFMFGDDEEWMYLGDEPIPTTATEHSEKISGIAE